MKKEKQKIFIVDTSYFLHRSFHSIGADLRNRDDFPTGLLTSFMNTLLMLRKKYPINRFIFALEGGDNFRYEIDPEYKGNRKSSSDLSDDFKKQIDVILKWIKEMGFPTLKKSRYEADDIGASLSKKCIDSGYRVYVLSADKDYNQLLSDDFSIIKLDPKGKIIDFTEKSCIEKFGIKPNQFVDYQALVGDTSDNVKGVKGVGAKGAEKLLKDFGSLDNIYKNIHLITKNTATKLMEGKESAYTSKKLVTLVNDLYDDEDIDIEAILTKTKEPFLKIVDELIAYEITAPLNYLTKGKFIEQRYIDEREKPGIEFDDEVVTDFKTLSSIIKDLDRDTVIAFDTETTGIDIYKDSIVGFSFAFKDFKGYYIPIAHNGMFEMFAEQMSLDDAKKSIELLSEFKLIGHNIKFDMHIVYRAFGIEFEAYADTMVLSWLRNPEDKHSLDHLAYTDLKHKSIKFADLVKKGENFSSIDIERASRYAVEDAVITLRLYTLLKEESSTEMLAISKMVENKFPNVLFRMEREGIKVNLETLKSLKKEVELEIISISNEIYEMAGSEFALNSPKQLSMLLYERLQLKSDKKNTAESTLSQIEDQHPIVSKILHYRESYKLLSTYIEPLIKFGKKSGRIHTSFLQIGTATGRLASREPNLQNVPIRRESGQKLRESFIADDGKKLVSLDYSQIELRFLAHFSGEETLVDGFKNGEDIHSVVAEKLDVERRVAKTVNFGLIYGMGSKKLAKTIDVSDSEANKILKSYFESFPTVKRYYEEITDEVLNYGYISTILGRRRYFAPKSKRDIEATRRESFNTLFQGSVADLIKLVMVEVDLRIERGELPAKMLLQIHDELIFEVNEDLVDDVVKSIKEIMENIIEINVPLIANSRVGDNWRYME